MFSVQAVLLNVRCHREKDSEVPEPPDINPAVAVVEAVVVPVDSTRVLPHQAAQEPPASGVGEGTGADGSGTGTTGVGGDTIDSG